MPLSLKKFLAMKHFFLLLFISLILTSCNHVYVRDLSLTSVTICQEDGTIIKKPTSEQCYTDSIINVTLYTDMIAYSKFGKIEKQNLPAILSAPLVLVENLLTDRIYMESPIIISPNGFQVPVPKKNYTIAPQAFINMPFNIKESQILIPNTPNIKEDLRINFTIKSSGPSIDYTLNFSLGTERKHKGKYSSDNGTLSVRHKK